MLSLTAPNKAIRTSVIISGSKSISNRLLILKEMMKPDFEIQNLSTSCDTKILMRALNQIRKQKQAEINAGDAGTALRFLLPLLCMREGEWTLTGTSRMKQRPVGDLVKALNQLGADIHFLENENYPPIQIRGKQLDGGKVKMKGHVSSQFVSALLLVAPALPKGLEIQLKSKIVSRPYLEMTVSILKNFGVNISHKKNKIKAQRFNQNVFPKKFIVESDWSSASYWYSICALSKDSVITLNRFQKKSLQADSVLPKLFSKLGVTTTFSGDKIILEHKRINIKKFVYDFSDCPDIAQTLAVTCFALGIPSRLKGLQTLKIKETDRILALQKELEKSGAKVNTTKNSISVVPPKKFTGKNISIKTYNDHRMAMSFAPLVLLFRKIKIQQPEVVNKSYPDFWNDLKRAGFGINSQP